jgi:hypothetical protein
MRDRRTADRGIESRRINAPQCDVLGSEMLARYLTRTIPKADLGPVDAHLQGCEECWAVLVSTYKLFASH